MTTFNPRCFNQYNKAADRCQIATPIAVIIGTGFVNHLHMPERKLEWSHRKRDSSIIELMRMANFELMGNVIVKFQIVCGMVHCNRYSSCFWLLRRSSQINKRQLVLLLRFRALFVSCISHGYDNRVLYRCTNKLLNTARAVVA